MHHVHSTMCIICMYSATDSFTCLPLMSSPVPLCTMRTAPCALYARAEHAHTHAHARTCTRMSTRTYVHTNVHAGTRVHYLSHVQVACCMHRENPAETARTRTHKHAHAFTLAHSLTHMRLRAIATQAVILLVHHLFVLICSNCSRTTFNDRDSSSSQHHASLDSLRPAPTPALVTLKHHASLHSHNSPQHMKGGRQSSASSSTIITTD
mmetsp:Transcript_25615/g.51427  ORF Transcript_25615/g.51427 Transcript_25615/m.51427 type:complete len:209 (+) Transcript_25615:678-1304(+)